MSFESDHERLLRDPSYRPTPQSSRPPSIASVLSQAGTLRPDIIDRSSRRPLVLGSEPARRVQTYRGFESEEAYLAALRSWVEDKSFVEYDYSLVGFYGTKTTEYYKNKPGLRSKPKDKPDKRRATFSAPKSQSLREEQPAQLAKINTAGSGEPEAAWRGRAKSLGNFFSRRQTVA